MYELYDREFDIDDTMEVIKSLIELRRINRIKNKRIQILGEDHELIEFWRSIEKDAYNDCEETLKKFDLKYKPYKII